MEFDEFNALSPEEKNKYLLTSMEMNRFYTLPLDERQAVLNRACGQEDRKKGSASLK